MKINQTTKSNVTIEPGDFVFVADTNEEKVHVIQVTEEHLTVQDSWSGFHKSLIGGVGIYPSEMEWSGEGDDLHAQLISVRTRTEGAGMGEHPIREYFMNNNYILYLNENAASEYLKKLHCTRAYHSTVDGARKTARKELEPKIAQLIEERFKEIMKERDPYLKDIAENYSPEVVYWTEEYEKHKQQLSEEEKIKAIKEKNESLEEENARLLKKLKEYENKVN